MEKILGRGWGDWVLSKEKERRKRVMIIQENSRVDWWVWGRWRGEYYLKNGLCILGNMKYSW